MAFLEGSKAVSTSIGGSTQTVNFNPVLNARGASSGEIQNQGATSTISPTVTTTQSGGSEAPDNAASGLTPRLSLPSYGLDETPQRGYVSPTSFAPGGLPSEAARAGKLDEAGKPATTGVLSPGVLFLIGAAALALWMWR